MVKVVHFIHGLNMGGAETLVKNYALLLDKEKFDVEILCLNHEDSPYEDILKDAGIKVIYLRDRLALGYQKGPVAKFANHYEFYFQVRKALKEMKPDILHVHLRLSHYLKYAGLDKNVCIFYTQHYDVASWVGEHPKDVKNWKWLVGHYNINMIALTPQMKLEMKHIFKSAKVGVINNGANLSQFEHKIDRCKKRMELNVPQNAFVVVHVGRFDSVKNHDFLLDVFCQIKKKRPEAFLLMVGKGEIENAVRAKAEKIGIQNAYSIFHDRSDVAEILQASDAAVFPSFSEGLPITVIEMQFAGLPCVVSDRVNKGVSISNRVQFLSLEQNAETWADRLLEMADSKSEIQYYHAEDWDIRYNVKQLESMYDEARGNG